MSTDVSRVVDLYSYIVTAEILLEEFGEKMCA